MREFWAIGLMTGTALDGFADTALIKSDGKNIIEFGPFTLFPYSDEKRNILLNAVQAALKWQFIGPRPKILDQANEVITQIYADAIEELLKISKFDRKDIDLIGGHGLTVLHRPPKYENEIGQTLQLLDGEKLAQLVGIPTVYDFRTYDMENGGHGAPLAPIYHAALLKHANIKAPAAILNLGGVANLTYWGGDEDIAAFDCGPANGPINELVEKNNKGTFDENGAFAASGKVDVTVLENIMANPWFSKPYPKSLDRYDFGAALVDGLGFEDGCATLCALVGAAVSRGLDLFPNRPKTIVVAGGGRKNPQMLKDIEAYAKVEIIDADDIGLRGDAVEAECFGFLAIRSKLGLPISFPTTTGVKAALSGGVAAGFIRAS